MPDFTPIAQTVEATVMFEELLECDAPPPSDGPHWDTPEKRLMYVILLDGIQGALAGNRSEQRWVLSRCEDYLTSFVCLCELFNLDPGRMRRVLQQRWENGETNPQRVRHMAGSRTKGF